MTDRSILDDAALDLLFRDARTHSAWLDKPVPDALLRRAYDLTRMGPTSANSQPLRILFVRSKAAKEKFSPALSAGNRAKTMTAPVTAIFAMDMTFYELMPRLFHDPTARSWFAGKSAAIEETAFRNSTLQAAYFMLAARGLGLDCGPMSGFDRGKVDTVFFADSTWRSNFICNIGYGDPAALFPRNPRLDFDEACRIE
jgi:3-hydroxypropanoate dehydrogenase